jgi:cobyrinic acid a,c-diamide synthase
MTRNVPRLVIAGTSSGAGKTTMSVALVRALRARGLRVAVFKCGPDYLDPTYHELAAGRPSHNLDGYMMGEEAVLATFHAATQDADVAVIEGVMGLFDGRSADSDEGSTAEIARWLAAPVLLVVDAAGMARSVAAVAQGFAHFDPRLHVAGLLCNRVGSAGHLELLASACAEPAVLGGLVRASTGEFPSRHLGLHAARDAVDARELDAWAERFRACSDVARVLAVARAAPPLRVPALLHQTARARRCRVGVAWDAAFSFYYPYNLQLLESLGAELVRFSPIADAALPDVDGLYIGGGYPELHAETLSANTAMRAAIRRHAEQGRPLYAECGGLMYLSEAIVTEAGTRHAMVGVVAGEAVMQPSLAALGYVEVETCAPSIVGPAGVRFRGHQFRYSELRTSEVGRCYVLRTGRGAESREGYGTSNVLASYVHAHWASCHAAAEELVASCERAARAPQARSLEGAAP